MTPATLKVYVVAIAAEHTPVGVSLEKHSIVSFLKGYRLASTAQASGMNLFSYLLVLVATTRLLLLRVSHLVKEAFSCLWSIWVNIASWHSSSLYLEVLINCRHYLKVKDIWVVAGWASPHIFVTFYNLKWFLGFMFEWVSVHIPLSVYVYRLINCQSLCSMSLWHSVLITSATDPVASEPMIGNVSFVYFTLIPWLGLCHSSSLLRLFVSRKISRVMAQACSFEPLVMQCLEEWHLSHQLMSWCYSIHLILQHGDKLYSWNVQDFWFIGRYW